MKLKIKKTLTKSEKFCNNLIVWRDTFVAMIVILIPVVFALYVLNVHSYIFPRALKGAIIFRLDLFYRYFAFAFGFTYIFEMVYKKIKPCKSDWCMYIFMLVTIISTIFAYDKNLALYGYPGRYEGMFTLLFYGFLYLNCTRIKDTKFIKYLIKIIIGMGFVHLIFVILQLTGIYGKFIFMYRSGDAIGLTENCNFLGSLMCMLSMLSLVCYVLKVEKKSNYYLIAFIVCYSVLLLANSSGPFISLIGTFVLFIVYCLIKKRKLWKRLLLVSILLIGIYPIILSKNDEITPELKSNINYVINIFKTKEGSNESTNNTTIDKVNELGHGRIRIWRNTFKSIKKRPLLGFGPDNLGKIYEKSIDDSAIADKAHNIYLNIWVSSGIFALVSYLGLVIINVVKSMKFDNSWIIALSFAIIGYSFQGIFNINVTEVTPYFFLLLGFLNCFISQEKSNNTNKIY